MPRADIVEGFGQADLMFALFDRLPSGSYRTSNFKLQKQDYRGYYIFSREVVVNGATRVIGVQTWDLTGEIHVRFGGALGWTKFKARYSTATRKGWIEWEDLPYERRRRVDDPGIYADPDWVEDPFLETTTGAPRRD